MATTIYIDDPEPHKLTTSTYKAMTFKVSHDFKIQNYTFTKSMGVGNYIASNVFSVGGHFWEIHFYPDGKTSNGVTGTHVSLFVELVSKCQKDLRVWFEFYLLDQNGNRWRRSKTESSYTNSYGQISRNSNITFVQTEVNNRCINGPYIINAENLTQGYNDFYKRADFDASQFIKDDSFTIQCSVIVAQKSMVVPNVIAQPIPDLYEQLLESKVGSDISFEVEGEIFYAHKIILSTRSPVFKAQFFGALKDDNNQCIKIEEMKAPVFKALLRFIYCDNVPDLDSDSMGMIMKLQNLLAAADRYGIETLKLHCESLLCENIDIDTVASTLALAEQHGCSQLKSRCLEFIGLPGNLEAVMKTVDPRI